MEAGIAVSTTPFSDRVASAVERRRSQLVVGLDPRPELLPVELRGDVHVGRGEAAQACLRFCCGIIDAIAPHAVGVKPQIAFFEALGHEGIRAFEQTCEYARSAGLLVIGDVKRGDIASTSRAYAAAYLEPEPGSEGPGLTDAVTVSPYLGRDALDPFVAAARRHGGGVFVLLKTSNAGSADVQDLTLSDGQPVWHQVARLIAEIGEDLIGDGGLSSVGAVIGATHPRAIGEARRLLPQAILLLPGLGAQGAGPADVARAFTSGPASALVNASRSVIYAYRALEGDWRSSAGAEAARLKREVWSVSGW